MRKVVINFAAQASSSANKTLVSKRIDSLYRITSIRISFDSTADHTVKVYPIVSRDPENPTAAAPAGVNLLAEWSQAPYFIGDAEVIDMKLDHPVKETGTYLKLYLENSAASTPYVLAQIVVEVEN